MAEDYTLKLPAELDLLCAEQLKTRLCDVLDETPAIKIDAVDVTRVGTSCVQILLAAARSAESDGGRLMLLNPPSVLCEAFADLGLQNEIQEWSAPDA